MQMWTTSHIPSDEQCDHQRDYPGVSEDVKTDWTSGDADGWREFGDDGVDDGWEGMDDEACEERGEEGTAEISMEVDVSHRGGGSRWFDGFEQCDEVDQGDDGLERMSESSDLAKGR